MSNLLESGYDEQVYSAEESLILCRGIEFYDAVNNTSLFKAHKCSDPLVSIKSALLEGDSVISGLIEVMVDGFFCDVAAYEYLKMSRESVHRHREKGGIEKFTRRINDHSQYYVQSRDLKVPGLGPREWRQRMVWSRESSDEIIIVYEGEERRGAKDEGLHEERSDEAL